MDALIHLSEKAAIAVAATLLAEPDRTIEFRGKLLGAIEDNHVFISDELLEQLPKGEAPADWQGWVEKNRELVESGMAIGR